MQTNKIVQILTTRSGRIIKSSLNSPILVSEGVKLSNKICVGDSLVIFREKDSNDLIYDRFWWLIGQLVGDGCYSYLSNRVDLTLHKDSNLISEIENEMSKYGIVKKWYKKTGNAITVSVESKEFRTLLESLGLERVAGVNKITPAFPDKQAMANFLRGLFDADGCCGKSGIRLVNISLNLLEKVVDILQLFGIIASLKKMKKYSDNHSQAYVLTINGTDLLRYHKCIGFSTEYKQEALEKKITKVCGKTNVDLIPNSTGVPSWVKNFWYNYPPKRGQKNKGKYVSGDTSLASALNTKHFSWRAFNMFISWANSEKIDLPDWLLDIYNNWYFYDLIVSVHQEIEIS